MAVYKKAHVDPYLKHLETYYHALKRAVSGQRPNVNIAHRYHSNAKDFPKEYTDIDFDRVLHEIDHFAATVKHLKTLKKKAMKPLPN